MSSTSPSAPAPSVRLVRVALVASLTVGAACARSGTPPPSGASPTAGATATVSPPGATPSPAGPQARCSATGLPPDPAAQPLPEPVADLRSKIVAAAAACDYRALAALALEGDRTFSFSFGGGTSPAMYWEQAEAGGDKPMRLLVQTMDLPHFTTQGTVSSTDPAPVTLYVWPTAHRADATDADWEAVEPLYGADVVEQMRRGGSGFLGYRVAITEGGDWTYFIGGD